MLLNIFHVQCVNKMCKSFVKGPTNALGFMGVILLRGNRHVSAIHFAIFIVMGTRTRTQLQ